MSEVIFRWVYGTREIPMGPNSQHATVEQVIHCEVHHRGTNSELNVSMVYGYNDGALRRELWQDLMSIHAVIRDLRKCIVYCALQELKSLGSFFTCKNKQGVDNKARRIASRIFTVKDTNKNTHIELDGITNAFIEYYISLL
ncbi:hypothetical protein HAX54_051212, partial [Datura stramonium]|nr:hypothetical protein [Datura stramonium]